MKAKYLIPLTVSVLLWPLWLCSCGEDRWAAYAEQTAADRWIEDTLRVWYYWADELPDSKKLNYFQAPATFFKNLLSRSDRFSTIDSLYPTTRSIARTDYSYGFEFRLSQVNDTAYYAHVLYTVPGSPADLIGLQRGDWVMAMDGKPITAKNYTTLLGSQAMQVTIGTYDPATEQIIPYDNALRDLPAAGAVDDNPVYCQRVFQVGGKQIGYLAYNHFTPGTQGGHEYDEALRAASRYFAAQQVSELILDLRYNNGGYVSCAQLLCTLLAPATALGQPLGTLEYNASFAEPLHLLRMDETLIGSGNNLNLQKLYVLTGSETASASEMVMNCLAPYLPLVQLGSTTVGKNVGSRTFEDATLMLTMSPIVCKIYNALGESDYENGFAPATAHRIEEDNDPAHFLPLGDEEETLLSAALRLIADETAGSDEPTASTGRLRLRTLDCSLKRHATSGSLIDVH